MKNNQLEKYKKYLIKTFKDDVTFLEEQLKEYQAAQNWHKCIEINARISTLRGVIMEIECEQKH